MGDLIPYYQFLDKRIERQAKRIKAELAEDKRRRINELLGKLSETKERGDSE